MAFPTSNATNTSLFQGADNSSAVLAASLTSSATSLTLSVASTFVNNQIILIDSEQIQITAGGGTTSLTVTRAMNGTTAASHSAGVQVLGVITAAHHNVLVAEIEAIESNVPALGSNNTFTGNNTFSGQLIAPSTILTSSATLGSASNYILNTSSIGQTATLPSSPTNGQEYLIANINTAPWTISASQGIFLAGTWGSSSVTSFTLPEGRSVGIVYNGTNWIQAYGTYQGSASSSGQVVSGFSGGIPTFTTVGGGSYGINVQTGTTYTVVSTDNLVVCKPTTTSGITVTLPTTSTPTGVVTIQKGNANTNYYVRVTTASNFDGLSVSQITMWGELQSVSFAWDSTNSVWRIVGTQASVWQLWSTSGGGTQYWTPSLNNAYPTGWSISSYARQQWCFNLFEVKLDLLLSMSCGSNGSGSYGGNITFPWRSLGGAGSGASPGSALTMQGSYTYAVNIAGNGTQSLVPFITQFGSDTATGGIGGGSTQVQYQSYVALPTSGIFSLAISGTLPLLEY